MKSKEIINSIINDIGWFYGVVSPIFTALFISMYMGVFHWTSLIVMFTLVIWVFSLKQSKKESRRGR